MRYVLKPVLAVVALLVFFPAMAQEYVTIDMEIDVNKPAAEVWEKIGKFCAISEWLRLPCEITSGDGGM